MVSTVKLVFSSLTFHVSTIKRFCLHHKFVYFSLGMHIRGNRPCCQQQFIMQFVTHFCRWSMIEKNRNKITMVHVSIQQSYVLVVEHKRKNLIRPKIAKVGYFIGVHHYFSAIFWLELLFQACILAWHVITRHASKILLCVFWLLAAVEMLWVGFSLNFSVIKNTCVICCIIHIICMSFQKYRIFENYRPYSTLSTIGLICVRLTMP